MRELDPSILTGIHGAGYYNDTEVFMLATASAALAGAFGYYMSYPVFSMAEALLFVSVSTLPTTMATGLVLGGLALYHSAFGPSFS